MVDPVNLSLMAKPQVNLRKDVQIQAEEIKYELPSDAPPEQQNPIL